MNKALYLFLLVLIACPSFRVDYQRSSVTFDFRPRLQLSAYYGRLGVYGGYAHGLVNYRGGLVGGTNDCHTELIRFGVLYKLKV